MKQHNPHFTRFVRARRKWFVAVFVVGLFVCTGLVLKKTDSMLEALLFGTIGSLVLTTLISLASIPVVWFMTRKKQEI
jgi:hypothetical protein